MFKINLQKNKKKAYSAKSPRNKGFTIIETMIAVSLFLVVIMVGTGSLLNSTMLQKKSQDLRSIMDSLSFVMDDISKNLRMGYDFRCIDDGDFTTITPHSCVTGNGVSFKTSSGNQWVYKIADDSVQKSVSGGTAGTFIVLTPPEIKISSVSGFSVYGAEPPAGDTRQPFATIRLVGTITSENNVITPFSIQTSISGRSIDLAI